MRLSYSIIISSFNEGKYLRLTIKNILKTTEFDPYEIVIVDDGSTDQSTIFLKKHPLKKTRLISISRSGVARARNVGARQAKGRVLIFVDAHTKFDPGWLKKINRLLNTRKDIKILTGSTNNYHATIKRAKKHFYLYTDTDIAMRGAFFLKIKRNRRLYKVPYANGGGLIVYREVFDKLGQFFEGFGLWGIEDRFFSLVAYYFGYDIYLDASFSIYHNLTQSFKNLEKKNKHILYNSLVACYILHDNKTFYDCLSYLSLLYKKLKNQVAYRSFIKKIPALSSIKKNIRKKQVRTYEDFSKQYYLFLPSLQINDYRKACLLIKKDPHQAYRLLLRARRLKHTNNLSKTAKIIIDINQKIKNLSNNFI